MLLLQLVIVKITGLRGSPLALTFRLGALSFPLLAANERLLGDPYSI